MTLISAQKTQKKFNWRLVISIVSCLFSMIYGAEWRANYGARAFGGFARGHADEADWENEGKYSENWRFPSLPADKPRVNLA